jgi:mxaA protein
MKSLKKYWLAIITSPLFILSVASTYALEYEELPDIKPGIVSIQIQEPGRNVGYTVGDILTRNMTITIKKPYQLIDESLPIIGYERRYKGQLVGIDLSDLKHVKKEHSDDVTHTLSLSYQVFTNNLVAKHGSLPQEYLRIINTQTKEVVKYRIPSWDFAISPLSIYGAVKIESDMSGFRGPLLLDNSNLKQYLKVLLTVLALSLLGLLYILGKYTWLPRMGGPFAKSYRLIRRSPNTPQGLQQAITSMHQSLNTTAGMSVFGGNLNEFFEKKPSFKPIKTEIEQFFALSRQVFFEPNAKHDIGHEPIKWLAKFCRRCRDCERGLIPDALDSRV